MCTHTRAHTHTHTHTHTSWAFFLVISPLVASRPYTCSGLTAGQLLRTRYSPLHAQGNTSRQACTCTAPHFTACVHVCVCVCACVCVHVCVCCVHVCTCASNVPCCNPTRPSSSTCTYCTVRPTHKAIKT